MSIEDITETTAEFEEYWDGSLGGFVETGVEGETLHIQITGEGLHLSLETIKDGEEDTARTSELRHQENFLNWEDLKKLVNKSTAGTDS